jgi:hypothetical protein
MLKRRKTNDEKVVALRGHRKPELQLDQTSGHQRFLVPAVKGLIDEGFSFGEVAEMLRVAADVLDGKNEDLY